MMVELPGTSSNANSFLTALRAALTCLIVIFRRVAECRR